MYQILLLINFIMEKFQNLIQMKILVLKDDNFNV